MCLGKCVPDSLKVSSRHFEVLNIYNLRQSAANNVDWKHYYIFRDKFITYREKMPT